VGGVDDMGCRCGPRTNADAAEGSPPQVQQSSNYDGRVYMKDTTHAPGNRKGEGPADFVDGSLLAARTCKKRKRTRARCKCDYDYKLVRSRLSRRGAGASVVFRKENNGCPGQCRRADG